MSIVIIILILIQCLWIVPIVIVSNKTLYCMVFERDDYKRWQFIIKNIDTFEIKEKILDSVHFVTPLLPNTELICWTNTEEVSLHNDRGCVLCPFYEKASKKVYNLLKNKYNL